SHRIIASDPRCSAECTHGLNRTADDSTGSNESVDANAFRAQQRNEKTLMKPYMKLTSSVLIFTAILASFAFVGCGCNKNESAAQGEQLYTCGMHPQVIRNKPGNCPICGMKLTPIRKQGGGTSSNANLAGVNSTDASMTAENAQAAGIITIDPTTSQNMGLRT